MLESSVLAQAVSKIEQRAERAVDSESLLRSFVDTGAIAQLENSNNQIIYGRRGSGKTHVLRVLTERVEPPDVALYLDCRLLSSSGRELEGADARTRALAVFRDICQELTDSLLEWIAGLPEPQSSQALDALLAYRDEMFGVRVKDEGSRELTAQRTRKDGVEATVGGTVGLIPSVAASVTANQEQTQLEQVKSTERVNDRISFAHVHALLTKVLDIAEIRSVRLLIDEWSEIEAEDQPHVAEYLKRAFFANNRVTVKIAALEFRSRFEQTDDGHRVGLELGGDISANTDLDDYFLPDRNPDEVHRAYAALLFRHLQTRLPTGAAEELGISEQTVVTRLFTGAPAFHELVRASEGVPRDFINIFSGAFFDAKGRGRPTIDMDAVRQGARRWFESDKRQTLSDVHDAVLQKIVRDVIGERRARCFMVPQAQSRHPVIRQLYDLRVIHRLRAGYSGRDQPGVRYDIFALDYGTYVDFKNTNAEPEEGFGEGEESDESVVPFDDHRSIRRIILDPSILEEVQVALG